MFFFANSDTGGGNTWKLFSNLATFFCSSTSFGSGIGTMSSCNVQKQSIRNGNWWNTPYEDPILHLATTARQLIHWLNLIESGIISIECRAHMWIDCMLDAMRRGLEIGKSWLVLSVSPGWLIEKLIDFSRCSENNRSWTSFGKNLLWRTDSFLNSASHTIQALWEYTRRYCERSVDVYWAFFFHCPIFPFSVKNASFHTKRRSTVDKKAWFQRTGSSFFTIFSEGESSSSIVITSI